MKKEFRILYVNGGLMDLGGISSYMINYAKYLYFFPYNHLPASFEHANKCVAYFSIFFFA